RVAGEENAQFASPSPLHLCIAHQIVGLSDQAELTGHRRLVPADESGAGFRNIKDSTIDNRQALRQQNLAVFENALASRYALFVTEVIPRHAPRPMPADQ